jgi:CrcB protein
MAGAVGAMARTITDGWVQPRAARRWPGRADFPFGTLVINLVGSLVLGVLVGLLTWHGLPKDDEVVLGVGFCGGFTTFSTFTFETVRLVERGERALAGSYLAASVVGSLAAAAAGLALAGLRFGA